MLMVWPCNQPMAVSSEALTQCELNNIGGSVLTCMKHAFILWVPSVVMGVCAHTCIQSSNHILKT